MLDMLPGAHLDDWKDATVIRPCAQLLLANTA